MTYERQHLRVFDAYVPGEQSEDNNIIKLNANECPFPPTPAVVEALKAFDIAKLARYPDPTNARFREVVATLHGLSKEQIIFTNAGDELLRLAISTFVEPGKPVGATTPAFTYYETLTQVHDSPFISVPLDEKWQIPQNFVQYMNDAGASLIFVINPHAPTGLLRPLDQIREIVTLFNGVVVLDEAYVDFVDPDQKYNTTSLINEHDNLLILRTLSKGYALAGLRVGYGMGSSGLIEPMIAKTRDMYNTDMIAQTLALAAIQDQENTRQIWQIIRDQRQRLTRELSLLGFQIIQSQTNFILVTVPEDFHNGAKAVYETLKSNGIFIRYFDKDRLRNKLRITVGTPEENTQIIQALRELSHD